MGRLQAQEFAELTDIDTALHWHARSNHFPPLPITLIPIWKEVIAWVNDGNDVQQRFALPEGISWKGDNSAPAWAIVEGHHLESWIASDDEFEF
jgi:hypothetical protein